MKPTLSVNGPPYLVERIKNRSRNKFGMTASIALGVVMVQPLVFTKPQPETRLVGLFYLQLGSQNLQLVFTCN